MSLIETAPKQKRYNDQKQDHGDAATYKRTDKDSYWDKKYDSRGIDHKDSEHIKSAMSDIEADYESLTSMTSAELSAEADKLLGETFQELELPPLLKASDEILKAVGDSVDAAEASSLIEEYGDVYIERQEILNRIDGESDEEALKLTELERSLQEHLESIEEDLIDMVNSQDSFPTEAEYGVLSKREIRNKLARLATEDPDYAEDDAGDSDFGSAISIKNRL